MGEGDGYGCWSLAAQGGGETCEEISHAGVVERLPVAHVKSEVVLKR
jgi:hypothetical protein